MEEGRIKAVFRIPNEHVEDVLAISGKHGIIVDLDTQNSDDKENTFNLVNIKMPSDKELPDILKSIENLPPQLRKATRGILPNFRGYVLRAQCDAEEQLTKHLNPKEAEAMGPALGLKTSSSWVVKGIPNYATRAEIVTRFAAASGNGWPGWKVRPRRTLATSSAKEGTATWLLDAANEPPLRAITLNKAVITIEMFHERLRDTKKATSFSIKIPKNNVDLNPGQMYEESSSQDLLRGGSAMEIDSTDRKASQPSEAGEEQANAGANPQKDIRTGKRRLDQSEVSSSSGPSQSFEKMFEFMQKEAERAAEESAKKDKVIEALNVTIQGLQMEIKEMREMLFKSQAKDSH